ncbi:hypothetical protein FBZ85_103327 [Azospirillum brasilense]|uniref:Uncharacterized protein n=1 Tax=Azospirillum baldaniorum TaxID=1064539 RepID=A0A9P1NMQ0_9PROT|nr:hypothetical protein [Azospirillum baldaniorum]TWA80883.1 hypothetical protein FBZ85_103327 [Azospirillum brasilense]CCC98862.1 protein of unknown function [Azospirillum baldaniorum]
MAEYVIRVRDDSLDDLSLAERVEFFLLRLQEGVQPMAGAELLSADGVAVEALT